MLIGDYTGHPFQVQLSRALAARGHDVLHMFAASFQTPKGELQLRPDDPDRFELVGITLDEPFDKENFYRRRRHEIEIGRRSAAVLRRFRPEVTILANHPVDSMAQCLAAVDQVGSRFVFWVQDLFGEAITRILANKLGPVGRLIGAYYSKREGRFLRRADHVVAISDDFVPAIAAKGVKRDRITVIENWSPIENVPLADRDNPWAVLNLPSQGFRIVYSGTLGFKHDPEALLALAAGVEDSQLIIFSEGAAAREVAKAAAARGLDNVSVRNWLDFAELPYALAGADLLTVLLEPDAGIFSVPSKVLTYMCAGRPIVGSINDRNLAARIIVESGAGLVCAPADHDGFVAAAKAFVDDRSRAQSAGAAARRYAEEKFDIGLIASRFENIMKSI